MVTWSRGKCKTLHLHFCNIYGHQTWQNSNLRWDEPTFKVTWPFDYVVTWRILKTFICTSTISMATKLGRVVTYGWKIPPIKSCDLLITWSRDKWKLFFCNNWSLQIWQSISLRLENPTQQVMWSFDSMVAWKIKKLLSAFQQHLWQPNLADQRCRVGGTIPQVT